MNFKVASILALMALVFVFTTTANPVAEKHVAAVAHKPEHHASEDHHHAAVKADHAAHPHHDVVTDGKKPAPISLPAPEEKAAPHHHTGAKLPEVHPIEPRKIEIEVPKAAVPAAA